MIIYSGTYGFTITISTGQDLSSATTILLKIKAPSGDTVERNLNGSNVLTPTTSGKIRYTTVSGDFPNAGSYQIQAFDLTGGKRLASPIIKVKVKQSL